MVELSGHCGDCRRQAGTLEERSICSKLHHCNLVDCGLGHIFLLDLHSHVISLFLYRITTAWGQPSEGLITAGGARWVCSSSGRQY